MRPLLPTSFNPDLDAVNKIDVAINVLKFEHFERF